MSKQILFLLLLFSFVMYSQKIHFKVGVEYRITPIGDKSEIGRRETVIYSRSMQLTGTALSYSIYYQTSNLFSFGISQSAQYSHLYYEKKPSNLDYEETINSVNRLLTDFKVYIEKEFEISENNSVFVELGSSLMNSGSGYISKNFLFEDQNGEPIFSLSEGDFNYFATNLTIGIIFDRFDFGLGAYYINESEYKVGSFVLPYLKINYSLR